MSHLIWICNVCPLFYEFSTHCILGGLFHCYMLDKSICQFRTVGSFLLLSFYFLWKILLANNVDSNQMAHYVASDLGLHCLPMTLLQVSR